VPHFEWHFLFVDDGSSDDTLSQLQLAFSDWEKATVLKHDQNRGLIAALQTGFQACSTEWVAVIDSDCTYDPMLLIQLLSKANVEQFDVVTASPYHPEGSVGNVPAWRIAISRAASLLYRFPMRNKLTCYTCCVRVYKTSLVKACKIHSTGFVGVTELLWRLDRAGAKVGEVPATLKPRTTGVSKMRTVRTMINHFRLMGSIIKEKLFG
jgi:dolichol-phosphate mannosyltransferase